LTLPNGYDFYESIGVGKQFVHEFANGVSRVTYGQDAHQNALCSLVALAGAGIVGALYRVSTGNAVVVERLLQPFDLHLNTQVVSITQKDNGRYLVETRATDPRHDEDPAHSPPPIEGKNQVSEFDAVIIATPLELSPIVFSKVKLPPTSAVRREFHVTHTTFVGGYPNKTYFNLDESFPFPSLITTVEDPNLPFSFMGIQSITKNGVPYYKLCSRQPLSDSFVTQLFDKIVHPPTRIVWDAYPELYPRKPHDDVPPFRFQHNLCYASAMETFSSAIEFAAVGGRNCAHMLIRDFAIDANKDKGE